MNSVNRLNNRIKFLFIRKIKKDYIIRYIAKVTED